MKAVLALIIIYIGTFLVAIQGASQSSVQASENGTTQNPAERAQHELIDPVKDSDLRSLMELIDVKDQVQDSIKNFSEQAREKLMPTVANDEKGGAFLNAFSAGYERKFDVNQVTGEIVSVYDKHFTDDDIKGLLQFYGSPLGQKYAAEMPKVMREIQAANREASARAAREALQEVKNQNPQVGANARLGQRNGQFRAPRQNSTARQSQQ